MALHKKHKRLLAYVGILGGAAVLALTFFSISQFEKAKYSASVSVQLMASGKLNQLKEAYREEQNIERGEVVTDEEFLSNTKSKYHDAAVSWNDIYEHFTKVTIVNSGAYKGTAIPAYIFSMSTLVAFGLILKHAEKAKEKEDEEEVLRQGQGAKV